MTVVCIKEYNEDIPLIKVSLNDGTVIAQGRAFSQKVSYSENEDDKVDYKIIEQPLLSIDNKYFFNPLSKRITITEIKDGEYIPFNQSTSDLDIKHWNTVRTNLLTPDVYVDQDISECDEEVKELVSVLNKIPFVETTGSCSGHGYRRLYIDIKFLRMNELVKMLEIIEKHFPNDFVISSNPYLKQKSDKCVMMTLYSVERGEKAFKRVDKLAKYIEMITF
jgi:hypothetical protein